MSMFNDIIWRSEDNESECVANAALVAIYAWSFLGLGSEKKVVFHQQRKTRKKMGSSRYAGLRLDRIPALD